MDILLDKDNIQFACDSIFFFRTKEKINLQGTTPKKDSIDPIQRFYSFRAI